MAWPLGTAPSTAVAPAAGRPPVRVLIVDDSGVVRRVVGTVVSTTPGLVLAGQGTDGSQAAGLVESLKPDVVVLDVEMPVLDGLGALKELKKRWPALPVIMFSTLTERGATATLDALALGADDYTPKPVSSTGPAGAFDAVRQDLVPLLFAWGEMARKRAMASGARALAPARSPSGPAPEGTQGAGRTPAGPVGAPTAPVPPGRPVAPRAPAGQEGPAPVRRAGAQGPGRPAEDRRRGASPATGYPARGVAPDPGPQSAASSRSPAPRRALSPGRTPAVVVGSSTGGPNALGTVLPALPATLDVPVLVVQHMPPVFTRLLAERLDSQSQLSVLEAADGMAVSAGNVYIAPGGSHMLVRRSGDAVMISLSDAPPENSCKPSVDVLFRSAVAVWGAGLLAVMLTGMGYDGLKGSQALVAAGGSLLAQDEASSVVWGMPGAVVQAGIANEVLPIGDVAAAIVNRARRRDLAS